MSQVLLNGDRAIVDLVKLREYCLSETHFRGRHKARVFKAALGLQAENAERLRDLLLEAARTREAREGETDEFGRRYVIDFEVTGPDGDRIVRSCWIIRRDETIPRLTTCYVL